MKKTIIMFWTKKQIASNEYADILSKHTKLESEVATLKHLFEKLEARFSTLQGLVMRKLDKSKISDDKTGGDDLMMRIQQLFGNPAQNYEASKHLLGRDSNVDDG